MTTLTTYTAQEILNNVNSNKELQKNLKKLYSFNSEDFIINAERYIKACKENRIFCIIHSVSKSGMSRKLSFHESTFSKEGKGGFLNFTALFIALGYSDRNRDGEFTVNGCGMDMVFHTNYSIIHSLYSLGMVTNEECEILAQNTPTKF